MVSCIYRPKLIGHYVNDLIGQLFYVLCGFILCILNERLFVCEVDCSGETVGEIVDWPFMRLWCVCFHL